MLHKLNNQQIMGINIFLIIISNKLKNKLWIDFIKIDETHNKKNI